MVLKVALVISKWRAEIHDEAAGPLSDPFWRMVETHLDSMYAALTVNLGNVFFKSKNLVSGRDSSWVTVYCLLRLIVCLIKLDM